MIAPRTVQRLPVIVLGSLGTAAALVLSLMWYGSTRPPQQASAPAFATADSAELSTLAMSSAPAPPQIAPPPSPLPPAIRDEPQAALAPEPPAALAIAVEPEPAPAPEPIATLTLPASVPSLAAAPAGRPAETPTAAPTPAPLAARAPDPMPAPLPTPRVETPRTALLIAAPRAETPETPATLAPAASAPPALREQDARALLQQFTQLYAAGDITPLMRLFTADARNNRGGREAIAYDYQALFSGTSQRQLTLTPTGWIQGSQDHATLLARYEAQVTANGRRRSETSRGLIRFDLRQEGGQLRISQVQHEL